MVAERPEVSGRQSADCPQPPRP